MTDRGDDIEVLHRKLPPMEEDERKMAALDAAVMRGIADMDAGRARDLGEVSHELDAELAELPDPPSL